MNAQKVTRWGRCVAQNKPMKERETDEQRNERLKKLREQFPWAPHASPAELVRKWSERDSKARQKLSDQQQRELLGFGGDGDGGDDNSSSDEDGGGSKRRRRRQGRGAGSGDDASGDEREGKRLKGAAEDGSRHFGGAGGGAGGDGGDSVYDSMDAEERAEHEAIDDWRVGRHLISRMGWSAEEGKGLGKANQGLVTAVVVKGRAGRSGLGAEGAQRARAGIPKNWPNGRAAGNVASSQ